MSKGIDKKFIDDIAINAMTKEESFRNNFPDLCTENADIVTLAEKRFKQKNNLDYYQALMEEVHHEEKKMISWTKEVAEKHLIDLVTHLEKKVYKEDKTSMSILKTITDSIKELNIMNGHDEIKIKQTIDPIKLIGFSNLKTIDDNGNIIDGEIVEQKKIESK